LGERRPWHKRCRAYEDTDLGMESIRAAGMEAIDVRLFPDYPKPMI
jgi:beta-phosphoglucomutase-like phosphatase (HAD superfamily)